MPGVSWLGGPVDDGDEIDVAVGAQARRYAGAGRLQAGALDRATLDRVVRVARRAQVGKEAHEVLLVQERQVYFHAARVKIHVGRLAGRRQEKLLALDAVAQIEQVALVADMRESVCPFEA